MPKLNVIGMVVLCLAVAGGAALMAIRSTPPRVDAPRIDRLIRRLGDSDPDLRREAERELKDLGRKAEPALKEAARGSDLAAERARAILGIKPDAPKRADAPAAVAPVPAAGVRLTLQFASAPRSADEPVLYFLRLHNDTRGPVAVARRLKDGRPDYSAFGAFERIDAEGRLVEIGERPVGEEASAANFVTVAPGETLDLFPGAGLLRVGAGGTYRVRYVYDASESSEYRRMLTVGHPASPPLPAERFESNAVAVTVP